MMRIGELARLAGTSTRSLRYYEEQGLLPARRAANGQREIVGARPKAALLRELAPHLDLVTN